MKVIVMSLIVGWAQYRIEECTRAITDFAQESRGSIIALPVPYDADAFSSTQAKACDIERFCGRMSAACGLRTSINVSAGIAAEVIDACDFLSEELHRLGLQNVPLPQSKRERSTTGQREGFMSNIANGIDAHRIVKSTSSARHAIRQRLELKSGGIEHSDACARIL